MSRPIVGSDKSCDRAVKLIESWAFLYVVFLIWQTSTQILRGGHWASAQTSTFFTFKGQLLTRHFIKLKPSQLQTKADVMSNQRVCSGLVRSLYVQIDRTQHAPIFDKLRYVQIDRTWRAHGHPYPTISLLSMGNGIFMVETGFLWWKRHF